MALEPLLGQGVPVLDRTRRFEMVAMGKRSARLPGTVAVRSPVLGRPRRAPSASVGAPRRGRPLRCRIVVGHRAAMCRRGVRPVARSSRVARVAARVARSPTRPSGGSVVKRRIVMGSSRLPVPSGARAPRVTVRAASGRDSTGVLGVVATMSWIRVAGEMRRVADVPIGVRRQESGPRIVMPWNPVRDGTFRMASGSSRGEARGTRVLAARGIDPGMP